MNVDFFELPVSKKAFAAVGHGKLTLVYVQPSFRWLQLKFTGDKPHNITPGRDDGFLNGSE
jgi:hypothetical protein